MMPNRKKFTAAVISFVLMVSAGAVADDINPPPWRGEPGSMKIHWTYDEDAPNPGMQDRWDGAEQNSYVPHPDKEPPSDWQGEWEDWGYEFINEVPYDPCNPDYSYVGVYGNQMWATGSGYQDPCDPCNWIDTAPVWMPTFMGRTGVMGDFRSGSWEMYNFWSDPPQPVKDFWVQITYDTYGETDPVEYDYARAGIDHDHDPCTPVLWFDAEIVSTYLLGDLWIHQVLAVTASPNPSFELFELGFDSPIAIEQIIIETLCYTRPLSLNISSTSGGTVTAPGEGTFEYDYGQVVSIVADANENYLVEWTGTAADAGNVANPTAASTTVTVVADYEIVANFYQSQIWTAEQMNQIGTDPDYWDRDFILMADIDLSAYTGTSFNIIGDPCTPFTGSFDGNGHTIAGFTYTSANVDNIGLFGYVGAGGEIKDLTLTNVNVNASAGKYVGALAGINVGTLSNCLATGTVTGNMDVGGLVGRNGGPVSNSYATCNVSGGWYVGGLVGSNYWDTISNCYATGTVTGGNEVGGLVGYHAYGTVSNCFATSSVSGTDKVGGLVGKNGDTVSNCYATGTVTATGVEAGGLLGYNNGGTVSNCYAASSVSGSSDVGGLVGYHSTGSYTSCFWDTDVSFPLTGVGDTTDPCEVMGRNTAQMLIKATFTDYGWDFLNETANGTDDIWRMCIDGLAHPKLYWQYTNIVGDFLCPDGVNYIDFAFFGTRWLDDNCESSNDCDRADMDKSGIVDANDLALLSQHWLGFRVLVEGEECTYPGECPGGYCKDDYDGSGSWCADSNQCVHDGVIYNDQDYSIDCYDANSRAKCEDGSWIFESCGTDFCTDTGDEYGGGSCSATDYYCAAGICGSDATGGADGCGGDDNPSVTYYSCSGGNTCVSDITVELDICTDTGDEYGGGSCSATDWDCSGGILSSSSSGGTDTCGGDDDTASVTYYSCILDNCFSDITVESDICSDTGDEYGGGSCSATDWDCSGGILSSSSSGGTDTCGGTDDEPSVDYYYCSASDGIEDDTCIADMTSEADGCNKFGKNCWGYDWYCSGGILSETATGGTDGCNGDFIDPWYNCEASDGSVDDTCSASTWDCSPATCSSGQCL